MIRCGAEAVAVVFLCTPTFSTGSAHSLASFSRSIACARVASILSQRLPSRDTFASRRSAIQSVSEV